MPTVKHHGCCSTAHGNGLFTGPVSFVQPTSFVEPSHQHRADPLSPQAQTSYTRHLESRNTTATNPLQLAGGTLAFTEHERIDHPLRSGAIVNVTSVSSSVSKPDVNITTNRTSGQQVDPLDLSSSKPRRNITTITAYALPRIHKRNKPKFDLPPRMANNSTISNDETNSGHDLQQQQVVEDELDKQQMDIRHKFTFMVNGKKSALRPPPPSASPPAAPERIIESSQAALSNEQLATIRGGRKVNRLGDFMSSDYDQTGFDVNGGEKQQQEELNSASERQFPLVNSPVTKSRRSPMAQAGARHTHFAPSSSSSALMSTSPIGSTNLAAADNNEDDEDSGDDTDEQQSAQSSASAALSSSDPPSDNTVGNNSRFRVDRVQGKIGSTHSGFSGGNVISDWSKAKQSNGNADSLNHNLNFAPKTTKSYGGSSRFSTLLSGGGGGGGSSNGGANQSGELQQNLHNQKYWDIRSHPSTSAGLMGGSPNAFAISKTSPAESSNDNESGYSKASVKKNPYPKAPVTAKSRYTSPAAPVPGSLAFGGGSNAVDSTATAVGPTSGDGMKIRLDLRQHGGDMNNDKHSPSPIMSPVQQQQSISTGASPLEAQSFQSSSVMTEEKLNHQQTRLTRSDKYPQGGNSDFSGSRGGSVNLSSLAPSTRWPDESLRNLANGSSSHNDHKTNQPNNWPTMDNYSASVSEFKTNFSDYATSNSAAPVLPQQARMVGDGSGDDNATTRKPTPLSSSKAPIVQRDLSYRSQLFAAPISFQSNSQQPEGASLNQDLMATYSRALRSEGRQILDNNNYNNININRLPNEPTVSNSNNNVNHFDHHGLKPRGSGLSGNPSSDLNRSAIDKMGSIVRTGHIIPQPFTGHLPQLRALVPAAVALLAQAQEDQQVRAAKQLRALLSVQQQEQQHQQQMPSIPYNDHFQLHSSHQPFPPQLPARVPSFGVNPLNQNMSLGSDQMVATSNHLGVSHLGPSQAMNPNVMGPGESNSYNPMASLNDYPDRPLGGGGSGGGGGSDRSPPVGDPNQHNGGDSPSATTMSSMLSDDQRVSGNDYQGEGSSYEPNPGASMRVSGGGHQNSGPSQANDQLTQSRSSMSDEYFRPEHKSSSSDSSPQGSSNYPSRNSVDPYEDVSNGISTSEYERDLADMDEEFNRAAFRRPAPVANQMMSDSYMSMSPDRYEGRRYQRRPPSYTDYSAGDYMNTAGSVSNMMPRNYHQRNPISWSSYGGAGAGDSSDLWSYTSADYSPIASYMSPSHYSLRWKPRYQRTYPASPYTMATAASEQNHIHPAYNFIHPSHYATSAMPTETVSIALSPLAAAAAAAASALAAADKTRHQNNGWLTLPRIAANSLAPISTNQATANAVAAAASNAHATTLPAALQAVYHQQHHYRPNTYAMSSVPIYAIAHRPAAPLAAAASAAGPSIIPYWSHAGAPAYFAYRPTGVMPPASMLAAASFAYPLRLPVGPMPRPSPMALGPARSIGLRPFYSDLQFAESKSKSNLTNSSSDGNSNNNNNNKGPSKSGGSLSAMAKNLTRKMFGSASQMRPQHVAPPNPLYDLFSPTMQQQNSTATTNAGLNSQFML